MSELLDGQLGPETNYDLSLENGKLTLSVKYDGTQTGAELKVSLKADAFIDKLKTLIPGKIDDMVLDLLKESLLKG